MWNFGFFNFLFLVKISKPISQSVVRDSPLLVSGWLDGGERVLSGSSVGGSLVISGRH